MFSSSSDPENPGPKSSRGKPAIWTAGGQRPRLDGRAFVRVTLSHARRVAARGAAAVAAALGRFAARVFAGEVRLPGARLGRLGRALPPHRQAGRWLDAGARFLAQAARAAQGAAPVEPLVFRGWNADCAGLVAAPVVTVTVATVPPPPAALASPPSAPAPLAPVALAPVALAPVALAPTPGDAAERATLDTIRSLIHATEIEPKRPARAKAPAAPLPPRSANLPDLAPTEPVPPGSGFMLAGAGLGLICVAAVWPVSLLRTVWMAARGVDLRLVD